ncbi:MAG: hypothetical protein R6T96_16330, partial [Longimicrobiales bacterium]
MKPTVFKFLEGIARIRVQIFSLAGIRLQISVLAGALVFASCAPEEVDPGRYPLIPLPQEVEPRGGTFVLNRDTRILLPREADSLLRGLVERWALDIRSDFGFPLPVGMEGAEQGAIHIRLAADGDGPLVAPGAGLP